MAINVEIPGMGESVSEALLLKWHKQDGDFVKQDEPLAEMETDKANVDVPAPSAGVLKRTGAEGSKYRVGEVIATIDPTAKSATKPPPVAAQATSPSATDAKNPSAQKPSAGKSDTDDNNLSPAVRRMVTENKLDPSQIPGTGRGGRVTKEDVVNIIDKSNANVATQQTPKLLEDAAPSTTMQSPLPESGNAQGSSTSSSGASTIEGVRRVPMSKIRKRIAENLVKAKTNAAILTTFNEVDMSAIMDLRAKYKEKFEKTHQIGLGFMSFFARACCRGLKEFERVNGSIDGDDVLYHDYVHLGIAVSTERGLAVPVLRNADQLSMAKIESEIKRLAISTREGKLGLNELSGGTFTITNGGIFGSMLSTPILNAPQSAILGMHNIVKRAVVINDQIVIRPMMYVALSYDHRLIDGRESVSFLVRVKEMLEDPTRLLLEV